MLIRDEAELGHLPALPPGTLVERRAPGADTWRDYGPVKSSSTALPSSGGAEAKLPMTR